MAKININTARKIVPMIYAYTTPENWIYGTRCRQTIKSTNTYSGCSVS